ncbi:DUF4179 domain-containing protein [Bacillus sp. AFS017336]|uniref:DUF4179 domain-containing protein n=1 Tax=Bacillus sp. AFS017336 TaxID=2033489 RepID=UPI0015CF36A9|nr:DUF4179 domain-containing protein [Bacillus sp. AFS017336]
MFEKEENELKNWKEKYENIDLPIDEIDEAIQIGFQRGKANNRIHKQKRMTKIWSILAASIFIFGILAGIRVSPTFADYITKVPGMEKIVEMIRERDDKGLLAAVENKYAQKMNVSQEKNGVKVTIDSVIADEQQIVVFYTINGKSKKQNFEINVANLIAADGKKLPINGLSFEGPNKYKGSHTSTVECEFNQPYEQKDFKLFLKVKSEEQTEEFSIPFSIKKHEKTNQIYNLNKTVVIDGQKIKIKKLTIFPLRVAMNVEMDSSNTKKILDFPDIRLVDQNGEVWSKIRNGTSSRGGDSNKEEIYYLQSNYFKEPKELYLVINGLQAIDKGDDYLVVDTEKQQILKQPKGNYLTDLKKEGETMFFTLNTKKEFNYSMIGGSFIDAKGKEIDFNESYSGFSEDNKQIAGFKISSSQKYTNPIKIKLDFFPSYIKGKTKIRVK